MGEADRWGLLLIQPSGSESVVRAGKKREIDEISFSRD
jgi:hypothetical protein